MSRNFRCKRPWETSSQENEITEDEHAGDHNDVSISDKLEDEQTSSVEQAETEIPVTSSNSPFPSRPTEDIGFQDLFLWSRFLLATDKGVSF